MSSLRFVSLVVLALVLCYGTTSRLRIVNEVDVPMRVQGSFEPNDYLKPSLDHLDLDLSPGAEEVMDLQVAVDRPVKVSELSPLLLNWTVTCELPDHPPIELPGTTRLVIEPLFACPRRTDPVVVDGRLDEWTEFPIVCREPAQIGGGCEDMAGPGGRFLPFRGRT